MSDTKTVYRYTERKFSDALGLSISTVKRLVRDGKVRSILLTPRARRLEDPADFCARKSLEQISATRNAQQEGGG
jgi:predicted site-specific integrase-resolvase